MPYNLRKRPKYVDTSGNVKRNSSAIEREKNLDVTTVKWRIHTPWSLQEYSSHTQDSESSEEEDNFEERLEEKEGWKLLRKAIDSKVKCGQVATL
ncbi:uncharacterized protein LOC111338684 isoform X2 [Stylophora pistillata]|uniref:uncharacterized protein LOC111338684 isoform X2 n=1 Tax=Stylophora pistillata TaxID=50429 RepID=UPI000C045A81|nr:uncharacterized protein LOC111338684 isoform X2 [Stylophora pistillata]